MEDYFPNLKNAIHLLDSNRGVYIPKNFAEDFCLSGGVLDEQISGVHLDDIKILALGPDEEDYWEAWHNVLDNATLTHNGIKYYIWQDGDLWAIPMDTNDDDV